MPRRLRSGRPCEALWGPACEVGRPVRQARAERERLPAFLPSFLPAGGAASLRPSLRRRPDHNSALSRLAFLSPVVSFNERE